MGERRADSSSDRGKARRTRVDPIREKAEALHAKGLPFQLAMSVAQGYMDFNEALERMARREKVQRIEAQHDLDRAVATQIVLGQVRLESVLYRRRFEAHRNDNRDRTCLGAAARLTFGVHGQTTITGTIVDAGSYELIVHQDGVAEPAPLHKLQIKYAYAPDVWKQAKKAFRKDKALSAAPREPVVRPQDRYGCSDRRLFRCLDSSLDVDATLLEGEVIHGKVSWIGRFEFGMVVKGGAEVVVFRHALANFAEP